jgi:Zn-dependent protease
MFGSGWRLGKLAGFEISINVSFVILLALVAIFQGILAGLMLAVLVFGSVVLHELGHAVVARRLGVPIAGIELHFFGGVAKMAGPPRSARDEILIAAAGPAVSMVLGGTATALAMVTGSTILSILGYVNLLLGGFNLLPALPMDGGRILRAALSRRYGRLKATLTAVKISHGAALAIGIAAAAFGMWHLILLAVVLWFMASQEKAMARMWHYADEEPAVEILNKDGTSAGWYTEDGQHAGRPQGHHQPTYVEDEEESPDRPRGPRRRRRVVRLPGGRYIVIEQMRW